MTRILGIDPGSHITGYGIVEKKGSLLIPIDNGCIVAKRKDPIPERLEQIYSAIMKILEKFKPEAVAIEEVFFAKNVASSLRLGEARGVALLAAAQKKLPIYEYSTREVKQALTGYGQAGKEQVQKMVQQVLKLPQVAQLDASDALAVAICHLQSYKIKEMIKGHS